MPCFFVEPRIVRPPWGGTRLATDLHKGEGIIGETWEAWPDGRLTTHDEPLSNRVNFPLLVKLLDTRELLSVQVHPDAEAAKARVGAPMGKAEAWVVLQADSGARIALGLAQEMSAIELHDRAASGAIEADLNWIYPHAGDVIDVPPGTIHAIGPGLLLYEIQEPIDLTWRLYDWGRGRELHLDHACAVADLRPCPPAFVIRGALGPGDESLITLLQRPHFSLDRITQGARWRVEAGAALTVVVGSLSLRSGRDEWPLIRGQTIVLGPGEYNAAGLGVALLARP